MDNVEILILMIEIIQIFLLVHHLFQSLNIVLLKIFYYHSTMENFLLMINQYLFLSNILKENLLFLLNQILYHLNDNLNKDFQVEIELLDIEDLQYYHHVNVY